MVLFVTLCSLTKSETHELYIIFHVSPLSCQEVEWNLLLVEKKLSVPVLSTEPVMCWVSAVVPLLYFFDHLMIIWEQKSVTSESANEKNMSCYILVLEGY